MKVDLTKEQCMSLVEFIDLYLLDAIRKDPDIDNLRWIENMIAAKMRLKGLECTADYIERTAGANNHSAMLRDTLAYIQQLEAQAPKWISVNERLPELPKEAES